LGEALISNSSGRLCQHHGNPLHPLAGLVKMHICWAENFTELALFSLCGPIRFHRNQVKEIDSGA